MKISKEKLIKLFKDGLPKLHIRDGKEMKINYRVTNSIESWCYVLENGITLFGSIEISSYNKKKYYISFFPCKRTDEGYENYDYFIKYEVNHYNDTTEFRHALTKEEFSNLLRLFKRKYAVAKNLCERAEKVVVDEANEVKMRKLEALSDEFELDFFPKTRNIIVEKIKKTNEEIRNN